MPKRKREEGPSAPTRRITRRVATPDETDDTEDDDTWTQGDFEVVTSDNVRFMVPSYILFCHSPVFRDAGALASDENKKITFTDDEIETAPVFRLFLEITAEGCLREVGKYLVTESKLAHFLRKYDCTAAQAVLLATLRDAIRDKSARIQYAFAIAAVLEDVETCKVALSFPLSWSTRHAAQLKDGVPGQCIYDPTAMPLSLWRRIPGDYLWAMSRAWAESNSPTKLDRLPDRFEKYLKVAMAIKS